MVTGAREDRVPSAREGARDVAPLLLGAAPFGMVVGVAAVEAGEGVVGALVFSVAVVAGASQLVALDLLGRDAPVLLALVTALAVNVRFLLYSASLAPLLAGTSTARRSLAAYLLTDQAYALTVVRGRAGDDPWALSRYYLGAGGLLWVVWVAGTAAGALVGPAVPDDVPLDFAVPLMFLALLVPAVTGSAGVVAAVVGGVSALLLAPLGSTSLGIALVLGVAAGAPSAVRAAQREQTDRGAQADPTAAEGS